MPADHDSMPHDLDRKNGKGVEEAQALPKAGEQHSADLGRSSGTQPAAQEGAAEAGTRQVVVI